jgi:hypothetical protein
MINRKGSILYYPRREGPDLGLSKVDMRNFKGGWRVDSEMLWSKLVQKSSKEEVSHSWTHLLSFLSIKKSAKESNKSEFELRSLLKASL